MANKELFENKMRELLAVTVDVSKCSTSDNIILERFLRIGDLVVMNMDKEQRAWAGSKSVPDGSVGIVVGFYRAKLFRGRINNFGHTPGEYIRNGVAMILWGNGKAENTGAGNLRFFVDPETKKEERRNDDAYNQAFDHEAYVDVLPAGVDIYEHDIVEVVDPKIVRSWETDTLKVLSIDWHHLDSKRTDGSPMPIYQVTHLEPGHGTMSLDITQVKLKERGNVWKWFNDKRDEIKFASLKEEVAFNFDLGLYEQVRCADTDGYHWPMASILPAVESGLIDVAKHQAGFFGAPGQVGAFKLQDLELGERCRAEMKKGFTQ